MIDCEISLVLTCSKVLFSVFLRQMVTANENVKCTD